MWLERKGLLVERTVKLNPVGENALDCSTRILAALRGWRSCQRDSLWKELRIETLSF